MPPDAGPKAKAKAKAKVEGAAIPQGVADAEPKAKAKPQAKPKAETASAETGDSVGAEAKAKASGKAKAKAKAKAEGDAPIEAEGVADPEAKAKAKGKAKGKGKAKAKTKAELTDAEREMEEYLAQQLAQEEVDKEAAEKAAREGPQYEEKRWVTIRHDNTDEYAKLQLGTKIDASELRKAVSKLTCVQLKYVIIETHGHEWVEAREFPLKTNFDPDKDFVIWRFGDRLQRLLDKRKLATINNLDKHERSIIHFSVIDGDYELTEEVVEHKDFKFSLINKQDVFGDTALHYSCILGYADIVELLLDKQADPEIQNINQRTATQLAAEHGQAGAMRSLMRNGANIGSNPGKGVWKYPNAEYFANHNYRNKVLREIEFKKTEEKALAEMEAHLAEMTLDDSPKKKKKGKMKKKEAEGDTAEEEPDDAAD